MTPIVAITLTNFRPFLELYIKGRSVIVLVHIRFPVARDLHFIARILKIREQIGLATNETNEGVVRVMSRMMPTLSLRHITRIGSVQILVGIIR